MGTREETQDAKELTKRRQELHEIYLNHDVTKFRNFFKGDEHFKELPVMNDEQVSELLHTIKSKLPYLGQHFHNSRRILRLKMWTESELQERFPDGHYPICNGCKYFKTPPSEGEMACMHLGAVPEDMVCRGFEVLKD